MKQSYNVIFTKKGKSAYHIIKKYETSPLNYRIGRLKMRKILFEHGYKPIMTRKAIIVTK